ncbi:MAG: AMP-binding protein, partial [Sphingomonadales bacterium]
MTRPDAKTLAEIVAEHATADASRPALFWPDGEMAYSELLDRSKGVARALLGSGVRTGDRVGVLLGNEPAWVVVALGASMIGATLCPLNTWYKKNEIVWTLDHSGARILFCASRYLKTDYAALFAEIIADESADSLPELVFLGDGPRGSIGWDAFIRRGDTVGTNDLQRVRAAVSPDTAAFVLYTSGSTAEPKGVLLNHRGVVENGYDMGVRRGMDGDDRVWLGSPLFYGLGATNALPATFTLGAALVLQGHFDAGAAMDII